MGKLVEYIKGVRSEMVKVTWPSRSEVSNATILVIILSLAAAVCVMTFDVFLKWVLQFFLNI